MHLNSHLAVTVYQSVRCKMVVPDQAGPEQETEAVFTTNGKWTKFNDKSHQMYKLFRLSITSKIYKYTFNGLLCPGCRMKVIQERGIIPCYYSLLYQNKWCTIYIIHSDDFITFSPAKAAVATLARLTRIQGSRRGGEEGTMVHFIRWEMTLAMGDTINKISTQIFHLPSPPLQKCSYYTRTNIFKLGYVDGYIKMTIIRVYSCVSSMHQCMPIAYCCKLEKPYRPEENFSTGCWT